MNSQKKHITPPRLAERLLLWFLKGDLAEEVLGDLDEKFYTTVDQYSAGRARRNYWYQVFNYMRPFAIGFFKTQRINNITMLKHNILISYRSFLRFKGTFLINLIGLSSGLACTLLIYLWVADELSMDKFHKKEQRLYQVFQNDIDNNGIRTMPYMPGRLAEVLRAEFPEVENATMVIPPNFFSDGGYVNLEEQAPIRAREQFVDGDFLKIFSFPLIHGNTETVMSDKSKVTISESLALKLFSSAEEAVGQVITWNKSSSSGDYQISGVFADPPSRSTMQFDILLNYEIFMDNYDYMEHWGNSNPYAFLTLKAGSDAQAFNDKIRDVKKQRLEKSKATLFIQQFSRHYLHGSFENGQEAGGRILYVRLFSAVAIIILLVACINFMNLSTARATGRLKEIGVKKALGARRKSLIAQYFTESILLAFIGTLVALGITALFLPQFGQLTDKSLTMNLNSQSLLVLFGIVLVTGLLSGGYPALYLSAFGTLESLKGKLTNRFGDIWARKGLVVFQFVISVVLISSVLIVSRQMDYIQSKNLGYSKDNVLTFNNNGIPKSRYTALLDRVRMLPGVTDASTAGHNLTGRSGRTSGIVWQGKEPTDDFDFVNLEMGVGFIETMGIELLEGRSFENGRVNEKNKIIFNEMAIKKMGLENPVGQTIKLWGKEKEIIGVVKDFHVRSLYNDLDPVFIQAYPRASSTLVKIAAGNELTTMQAIEDIYAEFGNGLPFEFKFLDQDYQAMYQAEKRVASLSRLFAMIAIIISCLGLLGLASFTTERRSKEIGIRKVLGAGILKIISLLSRDFAGMIVIALVIGLPVSYLITRSWLEGFAFSIAPEVIYFVLAGVVTIAVAWLAVGFQTLRAARANPVDSLRSE